jgi:hypothetical protein
MGGAHQGGRAPASPGRLPKEHRTPAPVHCSRSRHGYPSHPADTQAHTDGRPYQSGLSPFHGELSNGDKTELGCVAWANHGLPLMGMSCPGTGCRVPTAASTPLCWRFHTPCPPTCAAACQPPPPQLFRHELGVRRCARLPDLVKLQGRPDPCGVLPYQHGYPQLSTTRVHRPAAVRLRPALGGRGPSRSAGAAPGPHRDHPHPWSLDFQALAAVCPPVSVPPFASLSTGSRLSTLSWPHARLARSLLAPCVVPPFYGPPH